jgi:RNA-directed DNA polymerase
MKPMKTEARRSEGAQAEDSGRYPEGAGLRVEVESAGVERTKAELERMSGLMEVVCERGNLWLAYERVIRNKERPASMASGARVQGSPAATLADDQGQAACGNVHPASSAPGGYSEAARRGEDARHSDADGSVDPASVASGALTDLRGGVLRVSYGFRPGRSAHQAVQAAQRYVAEGRRVVVDMDLEKFFDRVNHDILMAKLAKRIGDGRVLKLIRRYLEAGMMAGV